MTILSFCRWVTNKDLRPLALELRFPRPAHLQPTSATASWATRGRTAATSSGGVSSADQDAGKRRGNGVSAKEGHQTFWWPKSLLEVRRVLHRKGAAHNLNHRIAIGVFDPRQTKRSPSEEEAGGLFSVGTYLRSRHLRHLLRVYANYYNRTRTHLSLNKDSPTSRAIEPFGRMAKVDATNAKVSDGTQRKLTDTEANLKQAKDEAAKATKEAEQARADAQSERQSTEAALKQAKDEAARAAKEAQQARADAQAARQSTAEAERKLAESEAARTATEAQKQSQTDPLGTWLRGLGAWLPGHI
jgi:hypothetical protein